jgi:hypothetical protein
MTFRPYDEGAIYANYAAYAAWKVKAANARRNAVTDRSANLPHEFDSAVWRDLKDWLLQYFRNKCAYCEIVIRAGFWGDVEHYRPKKMVEEDPAHPGYYWLAYDPENLMPSCQMCNQGGGKKNYFPVRPGTRAYNEAAVAGEEPFLLNPYKDDPRQFLNFDFDSTSGRPTGYVSGKSERGIKSVKIYNLNRPELVEERLEAQLSSIDSFKTERTEFLGRLKQGELSYAAARWSAICDWWEWEKSRRDRLLVP